MADDYTIVDHLYGPHEWGYRDPVEGGFIEDNRPFKAAVTITDLTRKLEIATQVLQFYANQWEQAVDAEQTVHGWHGSIGGVEPSGQLQEDEGSLARQALTAINGGE